MTTIIALSGILQVTLGVYMGWPLGVICIERELIGPIKSRQRSLHCHIDTRMIGIVPMTIAADMARVQTTLTKS